MNDMLKIFLSMSFSGSLMVIIFFAGKLFIKDRISRQWQYYIWLIIIARLLLPFAPQKNLMGTIFQTIDHVSYQTDAEKQPNSIKTNMENFSLISSIESQQEIAKQTDVSPIKQIVAWLKENIWLVWLMVTLILMIQKVTIYRNFVRYIKAGQNPVTDSELLEQLDVIREQKGVKKTVEISVNPLISSPMLIGFFNPCIVIPSTNISEKDFHYTVVHEMTHFYRKDIFYKWLVQLTVCLHWFNPFVYLMSREINKACELSCDETIVAKLDSNSAKEYGMTLLNAMKNAGRYKETLASFNLSESKELLKERLGAIAGFKLKSRLAAVVTFLFTLALLCGASYVGANASITNSDSYSYLTSELDLTSNPYAIYSKYGISYDKKTDSLFYNEELIRYFEDNSIKIYDNASVDGEFIIHTDKIGNGKIDVYANRNSKKELTGVKKASDKKFMEKTNGAKHMKKTISRYKNFGITVDAVGDMYFDGFLVRSLKDPVRESIVAWTIGLGFPKDSIDIIVTYSNGQISGLSKASKKEYDLETQRRIESILELRHEQRIQSN